MRTLLIAIVAAAGFVWGTSGALPDPVAAHFAASGAADGFVPRIEYLVFMLALVIAVPVLLVGVGRLAGRLPARFVNVPNRHMRLAPERRTAALASVAAFGVRMAYATLALLCVAHGFVVQANRQDPPRLEQLPFVGLVALFLLAAFVGVLFVLRRFLVPPDR